MYKKILVPLDGSELAECTLPHVRAMAKEGSIGDVVLIEVVEMELPFAYVNSDDISIGGGIDFQAIWDEQITKANTYVTDLAARLRSEGIKAEAVVVKGGRTASMLLDFAQKNSVDLIIMATHGYTGLKKMLLGSVAFRILHESPVPVLLIRPESCH